MDPTHLKQNSSLLTALNDVQMQQLSPIKIDLIERKLASNQINFSNFHRNYFFAFSNKKFVPTSKYLLKIQISSPNVCNLGPAFLRIRMNTSNDRRRFFKEMSSDNILKQQSHFNIAKTQIQPRFGKSYSVQFASATLLVFFHITNDHYYD